MAAVPRVVTGTAVIDSLLPVVCGYAASAISGMLLEFTDEIAQLLALAVMFYLLFSGVRGASEFLALRNDGVIDGYERFFIYDVELVQWFLFFLSSSLAFQWLTRFLADYPLMPWYEAAALASVLIMVMIAFLPRTLLTVAASASIASTVAATGAAK
jgi:hypothetical protein